MSVQSLRLSLLQLQDNPELESAWHELQEQITSPELDATPEETVSLLETARRWHESRRDWESVVRLLELSIALLLGDPKEATLQAELGRVLREELFDEKSALEAYQRVLELRPEQPVAQEVVARHQEKASRWQEVVTKFVTDANVAPDPGLRSDLLTSASETEWRYGTRQDPAETVNRAEEALRLNPKNRRAARLLECMYRSGQRWEDVARVLSVAAAGVESKDDQLALQVRLARVVGSRLQEPQRAAQLYEHVLDVAPGHGEAMSYLAHFFRAGQRWDDLVALYEDQLQSGTFAAGHETEMVRQIAEIHWRNRGRPEAAEPWFEKLRKLQPADPEMLAFFREWCGTRKEKMRLVDILGDAQRILPDGPERAALSSEVAKLAEGEANTAKAMEHYKALLRQDPANQEARSALKRLYAQTEAWNALVELLRQQVERAADDETARLNALRELAHVYRNHVKSDAALVSVLTQVVQLEPTDREAVAELVEVLESLSRWRDLLVYQQKLAELTQEPDQKGNLYRIVARRWLEQFSNVQNSLEAYEALLRAVPGDEEARSKLRELYTKRRAWPQLFGLLETELAQATGADRGGLLVEMAKLAAERLDRGTDALRLYQEALQLREDDRSILDALEKQAEREKNYAIVAEVLERRVESTADDASRIPLFQKLGTVYAERLSDAEKAAGAWRRILTLQPGHAKAMRVIRDIYLAANDLTNLETLYASQGDWDGLAEVLSVAADRATDPTWKIRYSLEVANVFEKRLGQPERAFRAYERILSVRPNDETAARALIPIYEKEERWARLPALYEILLAYEKESEARVRLYRKLTETTGHRLLDKTAALGYAGKAYEETPEDSESLAFFENAARSAGTWELFVATVRNHLETTTSKKKKRSNENATLWARLADILASELGKLDEAIGIYRTLVENDPGQTTLVATLEKMLRAAGRHDDLRWLFELRLDQARAVGERVDLLIEWATLEEEVFGHPAQAMELYRRVLAESPTDAKALAALPPLLLAAGDAAGAYDILALRRDLSEGTERAERELHLAALSLDSLENPPQALVAVVRALDVLDQDARAISLLERLLMLPATKAEAASLLRDQYSRMQDAHREARVLDVMLDDQPHDAAARLELFRALADVQHEKLRSPGTALTTLLRAVREYATDLALWEQTEKLAHEARRLTDLAEAYKEALLSRLPETVELELCRQAAALHSRQLQDMEAAIPYLERILTKDRGNDAAFEQLKHILTSTRRWSQLEELYQSVTGAAEETSRKVMLFLEAATLCNEVIGDPPKAVGFYEKVLELDPDNDEALRALDTLYQGQNRSRDLAKLLDRRLTTVGGEEARSVKLRLGRVYLEELHEPALALVHLEELLREEPADGAARQLMERILAIGSLRARAAEVLEFVYEQRDEVRDLVRILEVRLESAENNDVRSDLWRRIAQFRDQRLQDDTGSFEAFTKVVDLEPTDVMVRERMLDLGRRISAFDRMVEVLSKAAEAAETKEQKAAIWSEVATILEDFLGDIDKAEKVYRKVIDLDPENADVVLPAAHALERIYAVSSKHHDLAQVLQLEVRLEPDAEARRELLARLGELYETVLEDSALAIDSWQMRLDDDPVDERSLLALERLYEQTKRWDALVTTLQAREQAVVNAPERRRLLTKLAHIFAETLGDIPQAIQTWRSVLEEFGADRPTLVELATLYERKQEWHDLAATLEEELALVEEPGERVALSYRLGDIRRDHLEDLDGAIEAYRQALSLDAVHIPCRASLEALLERKEVKRQAAEILRPLYEMDSDFEKLLRVLDVLDEEADSTGERLAVLDEAARISEVVLRNSTRAFAYAVRGTKCAVGEAELPAWLARIEGLAQDTGRVEDLVKTLCEIAPDVLDENLKLEVMLRAAELYRNRLGDRAQARVWYEQAFETREEDVRVQDALASLYEETGNFRALLLLVKRQADAAEDPIRRRELLYKQARLTWEKLGEAEQAIDVFEAILDLSLDGPAVAALAELYTDAKRYDDLVSLYERQIDVHPYNEADLRVQLALVLEKYKDNLPAAFDELEETLRLEDQHAGAMARLEQLLDAHPDKQVRARAAEILEPVYLHRADWKRVMGALEVRAAASEDSEERRSFIKRLAQLHEEQEEDYRAAFELVAQLLAEDPANEEVWTELERLARVAGAEERLAHVFAVEVERVTIEEPHSAELAKRAGLLYAELGNLDRALTFLRRALAFEPESKMLFASIDQLLLSAGRNEERIELYREALRHRFEPGERLATLHMLAELEEKGLPTAERAIETYRAALDVDESDAVAFQALARLYEKTEKWRDYADLYQQRIDLERDPARVASHRLALARVYANHLRDVSACVDQLEEIVREFPGHREAIAELERLTAEDEYKARIVEVLRPLYEESDAWTDLLRLNLQRLELAHDRHEKVAVLRENAKIYEERARDDAQAFDSLRQAFLLDPEDADLQTELERTTELTGLWDTLASTYEQASQKAQGEGLRSILRSLAGIHDTRRDDPRRALATYEKLFATDELDIEPLEAMDLLSMMLSDWTSHVQVLQRKIELVDSDQARAQLWRRLGEAKRDMLEDAAGALSAYEHALELEPTHVPTLESLVQLHEELGRSEPLVELYRRRMDLLDASENDQKYQLLRATAEVQERALGRTREAADTLHEALDLRPDDLAVMSELHRIFAQEKLWPDLLEILRKEVGASQTQSDKVAFQRELADLYRTHLEEPEEAFDAYRLVLEQAPDDGATPDALYELAEKNEELRSRVADLLEPVLRRAHRWDDLLRIFELRSSTLHDPLERARCLRAMAEVEEQQLQRWDRAQSHLQAALAATPDEQDLHADIERLVVRTENYAGYANAIEQITRDIFEPRVLSDLFVRLGRLAEEKLADPPRAVEAYKAALEQEADQPSLLAALDRLYEAVGDRQALADVLERRVDVESEPTLRADCFFRLAKLQIHEFHQGRMGLANLRLCLDLVPPHEGARETLEALTEDPELFDDAAETLEGVYREQGDYPRLAALLEKRIARADLPSDRLNMSLTLARIVEERLHDPARAQQLLQRSLREDVADPDVLQEIERLASVTAGFVSAAASLEEAVQASPEVMPDVARDLYLRLATWHEHQLANAEAAERVLALAFAKDPEAVEILRSIERLQRAQGKTKELLQTIRQQAQLEPSIETKRTLLQQAKQLADELEDRELAESVVRQLLDENEADAWAIEELVRLREAANDWKEAVQWQLRFAELAMDGAVIAARKHQAARWIREKLNDEAEAIALYEELLESDPGDEKSAQALRELYQRSDRHRDLALLLERLIDQAMSPPQRTRLRVELARLQADTLASPEDAMDTLRAVLDEEMGHTDAVVLLSEIYEKNGKDDELAELLDRQIELATERGDENARLAFQVRLGEIYDSRLGDKAKAIETYEAVLEKQPMHAGALRALARLCESTGDLPRAIQALSKVLEQESGAALSETAAHLADLYEQRGDKSEAIQCLRRALSVNEANDDVRERLRTLLVATEQWGPVASLLSQKAEFASENNQKVALLRQAAEIYLTKCQDPVQAASVLERASALAPDDRELLLLLCDAYSSSGRGREAAQALEKIVASYGGRRSKELAAIHHRLANAYRADGNLERAVTELDAAFKIDPGSVAILKELGALCVEVGDLDRAQKTYRALLLQKLDAGAPITKAEVFYHLGDILFRQNDKVKATQMLDRALENNADLQLARDLLARIKG